MLVWMSIVVAVKETSAVVFVYAPPLTENCTVLPINTFAFEPEPIARPALLKHML